MNVALKIILLQLGLFVAVQISFASGWPVVLFSDLSDGTVSGWEGSATKGAAVSIWGRNFGAERGSSYVTVGGVNLTSDSDYAEWCIVNTTGNYDTGYNSAQGFERITFWLNSSMALGITSISVTTPDGTSETIPFYTRNTGNIYFVSTSGNNSNNGLTVATAWLEPKKARASLAAGDVAYFKAGNYGTEDAWGANIDFLNTNHANGTENNSISMVSYPGEFASLVVQSETIRHHGSSGDVLNYWTFAKFIMRPVNHISNWGLLGLGTDDHVRFIANDMSTYPSYKPTILPFSGQSGSNWLQVIGNYVHDAYVHNRGDALGDDSHSYGIYISGYGYQYNYRIGYNEIAWIPDGKGIQVYGHTVSDFVDDIHIFNNYIHHTHENGMVVGGGDGGTGFDDKPMSQPYQFIGDAYIYNNIVDSYNYGNSASVREGIQFGQSNWDQIGGNYYVYNNTVGQGDFGGECLMPQGNPDFVSIKNNIFINSNSFYDGDFDEGTVVETGKNLYFGGASDIPSWEGNYLSANPLLISANPLIFYDYALQSGSPARDAGTSSVSSVVTKDFLGLSRLQGAGYDIGAIEYTDQVLIPSDTTPPAAPGGITVK